jgi:hypothetical protein
LVNTSSHIDSKDHPLHHVQGLDPEGPPMAVRTGRC